MAQPNANTLAHLEWLGFVQPTGLVVSAPALDKAGAVLQRSDQEGQRRLQAAVEYRRVGSGDEPSALLPDFEPSPAPCSAGTSRPGATPAAAPPRCRRI